MNSVWIAAIWAGAVVLICTLILYRLGRPLAGVLNARRDRIEANNEQDRATALERQNEAKLARATAPESAEYRKTQLRQETAEADAAAEVARSTIPAQIVAEEQVIAARAEGHAAAAKDRAMSGEGIGTEQLQLLLEAYREYREEWQNVKVTFEQWLGELRCVDGQLTRR